MLGMWDVIFGLIYQILFVGIFMIKIEYGILSKPDSSYPFPKKEFANKMEDNIRMPQRS